MTARRLPLLLAALALAPSAPAHAGPSWISIELPANPLDRTTRGAFLLVHGFHHDRAALHALEGRAIGLVDGRRREIALRFEPTSREGVMALRRSWPEEGAWLLVITLPEGHGAGATALVGVGGDGAVRSVRVPSRPYQGFEVPRGVTPEDIEGALRSLALAPERSRSAPGAAILAGAFGALLLVPAWARRRRA